MAESQALSNKNSDLNAEFSDALEDCRHMCAEKLAELFEQDFQRLVRIAFVDFENFRLDE